MGVNGVSGETGGASGGFPTTSFPVEDGVEEEESYCNVEIGPIAVMLSPFEDWGFGLVSAASVSPKGGLFAPCVTSFASFASDGGGFSKTVTSSPSGRRGGCCEEGASQVFVPSLFAWCCTLGFDWSLGVGGSCCDEFCAATGGLLFNGGCDRDGIAEVCL